MRTNDTPDMKLIKFQDPDSEVTPLIVRTGFTMYDTGSFDLVTSAVPVVFDLWLVYDTKLYKQTFGSVRDELPWTMPNALELDITKKAKYQMYGLDLDSLNIFTKKQKFDENANLTAFTVETYSCRGVLKLTTFPAEDPFQSIYLVVKLALDGTPGSEMTQFQPSKDDCYFPGIRKKSSDFTKNREKIREHRIDAKYGEYSRIYFMFEYTKSPLEDIAKYYLIPLLINLLTIGFYDSVEFLFDSAGTYFLAIIALLFTLPETGAFTRNEKAVVFGSVWMLVILVVLIDWPTLESQIILWSAVGVSYLMLFIYDWTSSSKTNGKYSDILFDGDLDDLDAV